MGGRVDRQLTADIILSVLLGFSLITLLSPSVLPWRPLCLMESSYRLVRQAISIVDLLVGLGLQVCQDLLLEKIMRNADGYKMLDHPLTSQAAW